MDSEYIYHGTPLPPLSDEAAVEILNFLELLYLAFQERYGNQLRRHYDKRRQDNIVQPHPSPPTVDPPF